MEILIAFLGYPLDQIPVLRILKSLSPVINLIQDVCLDQMPIMAKDVAKATEGDEIPK